MTGVRAIPVKTEFCVDPKDYWLEFTSFRAFAVRTLVELGLIDGLAMQLVNRFSGKYAF